MITLPLYLQPHGSTLEWGRREFKAISYFILMHYFIHWVLATGTIFSTAPPNYFITEEYNHRASSTRRAPALAKSATHFMFALARSSQPTEKPLTMAWFNRKTSQCSDSSPSCCSADSGASLTALRSRCFRIADPSCTSIIVVAVSFPPKMDVKNGMTVICSRGQLKTGQGSSASHMWGTYQRHRTAVRR